MTFVRAMIKTPEYPLSKRCTRRGLLSSSNISASASAFNYGGLTGQTRLARGNPGGLFKAMI